MIGIRSRLKNSYRLDGPENRHAIEKFYQLARGNEKDHSVIDLSHPSYGDLLGDVGTCSRYFGSPNAHILDLGCGGFTFWHYLVRRQMTPALYIGVDLTINETSCPDVENFISIEGDMCKSIDVNLSGVNLVFSSNSLVYVLEIDDLIRSVTTNIARGAEFVIVEPFPSLFWEDNFDGIRVFHRFPSEMDKIMARNGWMRVGLSIPTLDRQEHRRFSSR